MAVLSETALEPALFPTFEWARQLSSFPEQAVAAAVYFANRDLCLLRKEVQVRANAENAPHSKRCAALSSRDLELSSAHVLEASLLRTMSKGGRRKSPN